MSKEFVTIEPDKSDLGGYIKSNTLFPPNFVGAYGFPPSVHAMNMTLDGYERDAEGVAYRRFALNDEVNSKGSAFEYNQAYHRWEGVVTPTPEVFKPLELVSQYYAEYGMGNEIVLHLIRLNNAQDSARQIMAAFPMAVLPVEYEITDKKFYQFAKQNRPNLLLQPYRWSTTEPESVINYPATVTVSYQKKSIDLGQAIAEEFVHPGLPDRYKMDNEKLLATRREDIKQAFIRLLPS